MRHPVICRRPRARHRRRRRRRRRARARQQAHPLQGLDAFQAASDADRAHTQRTRRWGRDGCRNFIDHGRRAPLAIAALTCVLALTAAAVAASVAHAGVWMRVSCINPDQSPAPSEGWTGGAVGNVSLGSTNNTNCAPGTPMYAALAMPAPAADGSSEYLAYTPPTGSTLVGGSLLVGLQANGYGFRAAATAAMFTPAYVYDASNVFLQCVAILAACQNGLSEYYGVVTIPTNRGGNLYLGAGCDGQLPRARLQHRRQPRRLVLRRCRLGEPAALKRRSADRRGLPRKPARHHRARHREPRVHGRRPGPGRLPRRRHDRDQRGLQRRRRTRTPASACRSAPTARAAR